MPESTLSPQSGTMNLATDLAMFGNTFRNEEDKMCNSRQKKQKRKKGNKMSINSTFHKLKNGYFEISFKGSDQ
jgi:hypothetical protein